MNLKRMKSRLMGLLLIATIIVVIWGTLTDIDANPYVVKDMHDDTSQFHVIIDSKDVLFKDGYGQPWLSAQDRTMVPVRIISENMGYDVDWEQETTTVIIKGNNTEVRLRVGENTALKNGQRVYIDTQNGKPVDTKSVNINGRVYVPLRFVAEVMGGDIGYERVVLYGVVTHKINITTGQATPVPTPGTDPTFDPATDVMPDGRLTKEKTTEYIEKMIEGTTLKKENGKYILEFDRPAIAEGFETGIGLDVKRHTALGYSLTTDEAYFDYNQLPPNQSFTKELDPKRMSDVNFYKFTLSVYKPGAGASTAYEIWYWPESGKSQYFATNEYGAEGQLMSFNKSRLFEGL